MVRRASTMSDTASSTDTHETGPRRSARNRTPKASPNLDGSHGSPPQSSAGGKIDFSSQQEDTESRLEPCSSSSISRVTEVSLAGADQPSTQVAAERSRTRQKRPDSTRDDDGTKSAEGGAAVDGQDGRTRSKFKDMTPEVGGSNSSSKSADRAGGVETHSDADVDSGDNNDDGQPPYQSKQSLETNDSSVPHGVVAEAEGGEADAPVITLELDRKSSRIPGESTDVANATAESGHAKGKGKHVALLEESSLGAVSEGGTAVGGAMSVGGGGGIGGDGRCFRKVGEKQLLFMLLANPEISPNKESNNNMRETQWRVVKDIITRPTPVEVTFRGGSTRTIMVQLDSEHLTEDKLKHRWQVHRTKYERKAKEHLENGEDPDGLYVEDETSESLWLAKAVRVWNAAKGERKRSKKTPHFMELSGECAPAPHNKVTSSAEAEAVATAATAAAATAVVAAEVAKGKTVGDARSPWQVPEENGVNHCNNSLSAGGEAPGERPGSSGTKRPLDVSLMEVSKHRRTNGAIHSPNAFVLYEDHNKRNDYGASNGQGGSASGSVVEDLTVPSDANTAAMNSGPLEGRTSDPSVNGASLAAAPVSSWSKMHCSSGKDHQTRSASPASGRRRGYGESDMPPVVQQLMSLLTQKTEADLEARRVEMDLRRAQAEALWRGEGEGMPAGPSPVQSFAPGRRGVGGVGGRLAYLGMPRLLPAPAAARDLDTREILVRISAQMEGLHAEVATVRDQNCRLREELRETNARMRMVMERLNPSGGGLPQHGGAGLLPRATESSSAWERGAGGSDAAVRSSRASPQIAPSLPAFKDLGLHGRMSGRR